jgi:23S rRNA maturation mini-RNase III
LYRNQNRAMAIVKVFLTAFNDCFARRGRNMNCRTAPKGVA